MSERNSLPDLSGIFRKSKKDVEKKTTKTNSKVLRKIYMKAIPLRDILDVETVKSEVKSGNILILKITPLANKNIEDVKGAIDKLCKFINSVGGDIARLGEERVVICPPNVKIWREKIVSKETLTTPA